MFIYLGCLHYSIFLNATLGEWLKSRVILYSAIISVLLLKTPTRKLGYCHAGNQERCSNPVIDEIVLVFMIWEVERD